MHAYSNVPHILILNNYLLIIWIFIWDGCFKKDNPSDFIKKYFTFKISLWEDVLRGIKIKLIFFTII